MFKNNKLLPTASIYGLIGGIPETFGGRTSVCLQRANAFAELDERDIVILTLSPANGVAPEALTDRLRNEGRIGQRVTVRNVWADLRRATTDDLATIASYSSSPITVDEDQLPPYSGTPEILHTNNAGKTVATDRFREDGSRFNRYVRGNEKTGKSTVLFDRDNRPIAQWNEQYHLYFAWLDWMIGGRPAAIINDGPPIARYLHEYRRENVALIQTIHSKHSADPTARVERLGPTYSPALKNVERFDRLAILTSAQRDDIIDLNLAVDNVSVLPNMVSTNQMKEISPRNRSAGVMLARTTFLKRIDHAIKAVYEAQSSGIDARFDIYGVADEAQESLSSLIGELNAGGSIALRGFDPRAKQRFEESSFTLLTSTYEGQSLVLLESMAAGCIPIAYDIKYGPSDIITHGVNGFLVPDGDINAMAQSISDLSSMGDREIMKIREAAVTRTLDFAPDKITRMWGEVLAEVVANKLPPKDMDGRATLTSIKVDDDEVHLVVRLSGEAASNPTWSLLTWTERKGNGFGRLPAELLQNENEVLVSATAHVDDFAAITRGNIDLWIDLRTDGYPCRLRIKGAGRGAPIRFGHLNLYATKFGSLSMAFAG